jgi:hypothetical protein
MNVAINAEQASGVFFEKFKQRIIRWQWLRDKYPVKFSGAFLNQAKIEDILNTVTITQNAAIFPKNIRAISGHSGTNSQEGKNILFFVCDEISGFDESPSTQRGKTIFNMMKSSAVSRFGTRYKGFALSFPRYANDIILQLHEQAQSELHWFSDIACTWEVKPEYLFKDYPQKFFEFDGKKIPLEYQQEFKADPADARTKYLCAPPEVSSAFIEHPEKVDACIDKLRPAIVLTEDYVEDTRTKKNILALNPIDNTTPYLITIDLGLKSDSAAFSIFHAESTPQGMTAVQDFVGAWIPDPEKNVTVSINDIKYFIEQLSKKITIQGVYFDQWNSALLIEQLNDLKIKSEIYRLNFGDYKHTKELLYEKRVKLLDYTRQTQEFKRLILLKSGKVEHTADFGKDVVDTVVGACKILIAPKEDKNNIDFAEGVYIQDNIQSLGGTFLEDRSKLGV